MFPSRFSFAFTNIGLSALSFCTGGRGRGWLNGFVGFVRLLLLFADRDGLLFAPTWLQIKGQLNPLGYLIRIICGETRKRTQTNEPDQQTSKQISPLRFLSFRKLIISVVTFAITALGCYTARPKLTVNMPIVLAANDPIQSAISIKNDGHLPACNVNFRGLLAAQSYSITSFGDAFHASHVDRLWHDDTETVLFPPFSRDRTQSAAIAVFAEFSYPLFPWFRDKRFFYFEGVRNSEGQMVWLQHPAPKAVYELNDRVNRNIERWFTPK